MIVAGIYEIVNTINGKRYIGSSENITKRWARHKYELEANRHHSVPLQRAWIKYNKAFLFNLLEEVTDANLLFEKEAEWIAKLKPEYNIGGVGGGDNISNHPNYDGICAKHSENLKKRWEDPEFRANQTERLTGETNPNWKGGVCSPTCKICGTEISAYRKHCKKCAQEGRNNSFYGKTHSDKTRELIKWKMKGRLPTNTKRVIIDGIEYHSQAEAARQLNVSSGTITNWLRGRKPHGRNIKIIQ
jgi:group I intron endonuclease